MRNNPASEVRQPPKRSLDELGEDNGILRNEDESDADYAERMIYELDVSVEELWSVQDKIRELVPVEPAG